MLEGTKDYDKRLEILTSNLFERSYLRISRGMLHADRGVLGMILCRIYLKGAEKNPANNLDKEFQFLLTGKEGMRHDEAGTGSVATHAKEGCALLARHFEAFK